MANTAQSKKRARQNRKRNIRGASLSSLHRTVVKKVVAAIDLKQKDLALEEYKKAVPVIDRMITKGIVHKNKAARHKSRLSKRIKALG